MQGHHDGHLRAQPGKCTQIEVPAVKVVTVDDVRGSLRQAQEPPRAGKAEILDTAVSIQRSTGLGNDGGEAAGPPRPAAFLRPVQARLQIAPEAPPPPTLI